MRMPLKLMLFILLLMPQVVSAKDNLPIRFSIAPRGLTVRSGAPVDAEVELLWNGNNLLEGRLEMTFYDHERVVGRYLSDEMAISNDGRKFHVMLPQMKNFDTQLPLDVIPRFITADGRIELGEPGDFQLRVPPERKRAFVIATSEPPEPGLPSLGVLPFDALRIEQLIPNYSLGAATGTTVVTFTPQEMPAEGLAYFSYDLLLLAGQGFSELKEKQLSAIADWIEAGGSALVIPDRVLEPAHIAFLNRVGRAVPGVSEFLLDKQGKLPESTVDPLLSPRMSSPGLGRVVILSRPLDSGSINQPGLRKIVAFLWKVRALGTFGSIYDADWLIPPKHLRLAYGQVDTAGNLATNIKHLRARTEVYSGSQKNSDTKNSNATEAEYKLQDEQFWTQLRERADEYLASQEIPSAFYPGRESYSPPDSYRPLPLANSGELRKVLTPSAIRAVPLTLVATVLTIFLLIIGPGDYYLLGLLRARKYTWILFPLVALSFTAFMVFAAQRHMGSTDYRNALVFVDFGDTSKPVRTSRYELIFTATEKPIDTELSDAVYARFDPPARGDDNIDPLVYQLPQSMDATQPLPDFPVVEGRMPTYSIVHDELPKWSPKMNRYTSLGSTMDVPSFDWNAFQPKLAEALNQFARSKAAADEQARNKAAADQTRLAATRNGFVPTKAAADEKELPSGSPPEPPPDWTALSEEVNKSFPDASVFLLSSGTEYVDLNSGTVRANLVDSRQFRPGSDEAMLELIRNISAPPPYNLLYCVSQFSPTGAGNFEDLALLDGTDPHQFLLLIVTRNGDDWIVYRKLYRNAR